MRSFIFAIAIVFSSGGAIANDAMSAFTSKNYDQAYRIWARDPDKPEALYGIGRIEVEGLGSAPKNIVKGIGQLARSSDNGFRPATQYLADLYEKDGNYTNSIKYLKRLTDGKNIEIETRILNLYLKLAKGEPSESDQFCDSATRVASLGKQNGLSLISPENFRELAFCAVRGKVSYLGKDESVKFLEIEATKLWDGKMYDQASKLWKILPASEKSLFHLGKITFEGLGSTKKDEIKGKELIQSSADKGFSQAKLYLINLTEDPGAALNKCASINNSDSNELKFRCSSIVVSSFRKELLLSKEDCLVLSKARISEVKDSQLLLDLCSYKGFSSFPSRQQAIAELKAAILNTNTPLKMGENFFITIAPDLLSDASSEFDPVTSVSIIHFLDPKLESASIRELLIANNIIRNKCVDADHSNESSRERRLAICTLVAYKGDAQVALELAKIYSKKTEYGSPNSLKARGMLKFVPDDKGKIELSKLEIELALTMIEGNQRKNLETLESYLNKESQPNTVLLKQYFEYQNSRLIEFDRTPTYTTNDAVRISYLSIKLENVEIMEAILPGLLRMTSKESDSLDNLGDSDSSTQKLNKNVQIIKSQIAKMKKSEQTAPNSKILIEQQTSAVKEDLTKKLEETEIDKSSSTDSTAKFVTLQAECAQNNFKSCATVVRLILGKNPPEEFKKLRSSEKESIARALLSKGIENKDEYCEIVMYDIVRGAVDGVNKELKRKLLADLVERRIPSGLLRSYAELADPQNIVSATIGSVLTYQGTRDSCKGIKQLLERGKLSGEDVSYANSLVSGKTCQAFGVKDPE